MFSRMLNRMFNRSIALSSKTSARSRRFTGVATLVPLVGVSLVTAQNCGGEFEISQEASLSSVSDFDSHPGFAEKNASSASFEQPLADRRYLLSVLTGVFGEEAESIDALAEGGPILEPTIAGRPEDFGGPCSLYEDYRVSSGGRRVPASALEACTSDEGPTALGAPSSPKPTVPRQAALAKTCNALVSDNTAVAFALGRIGGYQGPGPTGSAVPAVNRQNMARLFSLFYRLHPEPDDATLDALLELAGGAGAPATAGSWKGALYQVCASPYWQAL